ncbi:MAG: hypothetical protein H6985_04325 [Pseudomonadales bacterium]|nr:hypothetical protein [Halioglobus sp.]MCP5128794.1 hypothetical protein [Pseudomonadales bacterium]
MRSLFYIVLVLVLGASVARHGTAQEPAPPERPAYGVLYTAWIKAGDPTALVRVRLSRHPEWVRWMKFNADPERYSDFKGTGEIKVSGDSVLWYPPQEDAYLQFRVNLESRRSSGKFDGMVTSTWAIFRADDLVPPVRIDMEDGTQSKAKLQLNLPEGWSLATPFPRYSSGRLRIDNPDRLFDRPTGWIIAGNIGTRVEKIGDTSVTIAAPIGQNMRRMDMLAFLRWNLPTLQSLFPQFPERLLVVGADDPMWRGALSAPDSLYVHSDRPLLSENATSTLLHEIVHVAMGAQSVPGSDWVVEGLAEYYSLETLHRSGTISDERFATAHEDLAAWGESSGPLDSERSSGAITARAVGVMRAIDAEIRKSSEGKRSLDDVARQLTSEGKPITAARFRELATAAAGAPLRSMPD